MIRAWLKQRIARKKLAKHPARYAGHSQAKASTASSRTATSALRTLTMWAIVTFAPSAKQECLTRTLEP